MHGGAATPTSAEAVDNFDFPYKISQYGRDLAVSMFRQDLDKENDKGKFKAISTHRLACHCRPWAGLSRGRGHLPV